jgi:hypothetical protein
MAPPGTLVQNWQDMAVLVGLGSPTARAFVAGTTAATTLYVAKFPKAAFREDGSMRPFKPLMPGPDGVTTKHFLVLPIAIAGAAFLFT